ncbi:Hypothetical protein R9X50_00614000 [Acrodontium crateriforme]|uniref:Zn(2)-C6 fungal-type domain-containing protein n=1 Tax=Acrodontium crateriforme TaxID=150365 RepID=A0AAQ3MAJ6_9PEZI|nr:Hypothetical protein R9X50_00614000 [Acrodontium crateriforme]
MSAAPKTPRFSLPAGETPSNNEGEEPWSGDDDDDDDDDEHLDHAAVGPSLKRKRLPTSRPISVSCEKCKERKVKCDRGLPSCGWCTRNGQLCEYKERKKPGLRAGYGRELESRLDRLEGVLETQQHVIQQLSNALARGEAAVQQQLTSPTAHSQDAAQATTDKAYFLHRTNSFQASAPSVSQFRPAHTGAEMHQHQYQHPHPQGEQIQYPSPHQKTRPPQHQRTMSSSELYAQSVSSMDSAHLNIVHGGPSSTTAPETNVDSAPNGPDFPPYDLLYGLTDLFFKHINTWCPILHRRSTLDSLFGPDPLEEADRMLLHAIVATTLRFSSDPRLSDSARQRFHSISKQKVLLYGLENSSVKALQALVILALDIVGNSNGPPGWNLLALITRSVVQLGLAVEATSTSVAPLYPSIYTLRAMVLPEPKSFVEDESRRRLFWMVYLLDRYATISTAFEFALDDKEIDRKLPCRDDLFTQNQPVETRWFHTEERSDYTMNKPENLGSFSYYVEVIGILSEIHRFLKMPIDIGTLHDVEQWQSQYRKLDSKLNAWKFSLPSEYGNMARLFNPSANNKVVNCIWIMLHMTYHTAVIRLHSSAAYPTTRSPIFTPSFSASQRCQTAVEDISALCTYVRNNNMLTKLGPPFAFSVWVAARLILVHGSTIDHHVNPVINSLVDTLHQMGHYWQVAERYATLLSRVLEEYSESERAPVGADGVRETPSTVRILADMRRTAYDLDFLISRQPRQHFGKINAVTPARTPAPNELEYLDVFDFFNMPRLPLPANGDPALGTSTHVGNGGSSSMAPDGPSEYPHQMETANNNEFNITNFMYDANSDWFMKNQN